MEREQRREWDRCLRAARPERRQTKAVYKIATKTKEILAGNLDVPDLIETEDRIGDMDVKCKHCGALTFKNETPTICCKAGKVQLPPFPQPTKDIFDLWTEDTPQAKFFQANSRTFNNAICLSSIMVQEKTIGGYSPNVIFQGKMSHLMGPLYHEAGGKPCFAQLHVLDSRDETTLRFS